ncbi:hypothetical protein HDV00_010709 [Rhizophlyctis rosea]|nr:hypothetical protein HDV00_010709 [Rhizophlyctis rosea]
MTMYDYLDPMEHFAANLTCMAELAGFRNATELLFYAGASIPVHSDVSFSYRPVAALFDGPQAPLVRREGKNLVGVIGKSFLPERAARVLDFNKLTLCAGGRKRFRWVTVTNDDETAVGRRLRKLFVRANGRLPVKENLVAVTISLDVLPADAVFRAVLTSPRDDFTELGFSWSILRDALTVQDWPKVHLPVADLRNNHRIHTAMRIAFPCVNEDYERRMDIQKDPMLVAALKKVDDDLRCFQCKARRRASEWADFAVNAYRWVYFHSDRRWVPAEFQDAYRLVRLRERRTQRLRARGMARFRIAVSRMVARMYRPPDGPLYRGVAETTLIGRPAEL